MASVGWVRAKGWWHLCRRHEAVICLPIVYSKALDFKESN